MKSHEMFAAAIGSSIGTPVEIQQVRPLAGGCINQAYKITTDKGVFFLKTNHASVEDMFKTEYQGLQLLAGTNILRIPNAYGFGTFMGKSYLVLSYVHSARRNRTYWEDFGQRLATLHAIEGKSYGFDHNNYIGRLPQRNEWCDDWITFFIDRRIGVQLALAVDQQRINPSMVGDFERIFTNLHQWLPTERPALIHGDLWSGNVMVGEEGWVCLVDPAVYYAHREIELAFTRLFGGFDNRFYDAYEETAPLQPGFDQRVDLYNLYPLLVHVNLFGGGYVDSVKQIVKRYLG